MMQPTLLRQSPAIAMTQEQRIAYVRAQGADAKARALAGDVVTDKACPYVDGNLATAWLGGFNE